MRSEQRITPTLEAVERMWRANPDWRLGQLLYNMAGRDPFYIEDDDLRATVYGYLGVNTD